MSLVSANALGLPDRRRILSTLAGAGALGLPALPALAAAQDGADAGLFALDRQLAAVKVKIDELGQLTDDLYETFDPPDMPEALLWQKRDFMSVWVDRSRLDSIGIPGSGTERFTYASEGVLETLRSDLATWRAVEPVDRWVGERTVARVEEIVAAIEAYNAEEAERLAACGYTAASEAFDVQFGLASALLEQMVATPATTAEGVCLKLRASRAGVFEMRDRLTASAMADAIRLAGPHAEDRRAA